MHKISLNNELLLTDRITEGKGLCYTTALQIIIINKFALSAYIYELLLISYNQQYRFALFENVLSDN